MIQEPPRSNEPAQEPPPHDPAAQNPPAQDKPELELTHSVPWRTRVMAVVWPFLFFYFIGFRALSAGWFGVSAYFQGAGQYNSIWWSFVMLLVGLGSVGAVLHGVYRMFVVPKIRLRAGRVSKVGGVEQADVSDIDADEIEAVEIGKIDPIGRRSDQTGQEHLLLLRLSSGEKLVYAQLPKYEEARDLAWEVADYYQVPSRPEPLNGVVEAGYFYPLKDGQVDVSDVAAWTQSHLCMISSFIEVSYESGVLVIKDRFVWNKMELAVAAISIILIIVMKSTFLAVIFVIYVGLFVLRFFNLRRIVVDDEGLHGWMSGTLRLGKRRAPRQAVTRMELVAAKHEEQTSFRVSAPKQQPIQIVVIGDHFIDWPDCVWSGFESPAQALAILQGIGQRLGLQEAFPGVMVQPHLLEAVRKEQARQDPTQAQESPASGQSATDESRNEGAPVIAAPTPTASPNERTVVSGRLQLIQPRWFVAALLLLLGLPTAVFGCVMFVWGFIADLHNGAGLFIFGLILFLIGGFGVWRVIRVIRERVWVDIEADRFRVIHRSVFFTRVLLDEPIGMVQAVWRARQVSQESRQSVLDIMVRVGDRFRTVSVKLWETGRDIDQGIARVQANLGMNALSPLSLRALAHRGVYLPIRDDNLAVVTDDMQFDPSAEGADPSPSWRWAKRQGLSASRWCIRDTRQIRRVLGWCCVVIAGIYLLAFLSSTGNVASGYWNMTVFFGVLMTVVTLFLLAWSFEYEVIDSDSIGKVHQRLFSRLRYQSRSVGADDVINAAVCVTVNRPAWSREVVPTFGVGSYDPDTAELRCFMTGFKSVEEARDAAAKVRQWAVAARMPGQ